MKCVLRLGTAALLSLATSAVMAQQAPPHVSGDPSIYKVIYEDQDFRVIDAVRKKGVHDKVHSHPVQSIVCSVTDCTTQLYGADGKAQGAPNVSNTARAAPITAAHSAENVGVGLILFRVVLTDADLFNFSHADHAGKWLVDYVYDCVLH